MTVHMILLLASIFTSSFDSVFTSTIPKCKINPINKPMRYCLRYMMKIHEAELIEALKKGLRKDTTLPI